MKKIILICLGFVTVVSFAYFRLHKFYDPIADSLYKSYFLHTDDEKSISSAKHKIIVLINPKSFTLSSTGQILLDEILDLSGGTTATINVHIYGNIK